MVRLRCHVSTNISGSECEDVYEVSDEELEGLSDEEREAVFQNYLDGHLQSSSKSYYEVLEDE